MLLRATENAVAGHVWPAGRYLPTPVIGLILIRQVDIFSSKRIVCH